MNYEPTTGQPFPDNKIPSSRIDPVMTKIMNLFPLPNAPGEYNNYIRNAPSFDNDDNYDGRVDWDPTEKNLVFFRYSYSDRNRNIPGFFAGIADGTPTSAWGRQKHSGQWRAGSFTYIFTPTIINEFRFLAMSAPFYAYHILSNEPGRLVVYPRCASRKTGGAPLAASLESRRRRGAIGSPD